MDNKEFVELCKKKVVEITTLDWSSVGVELPTYITTDDVYVVWLNRTLQNNKALLSTTITDGMYYEVTYNGDKDELYFDAYKHVVNREFKLGDE